MTKGVFSRHLHRTSKGHYVTKDGWLQSRIRPGIAERLIAEGKCREGKRIPNDVWPYVARNLETHNTKWLSSGGRIAIVEPRPRELRLLLDRLEEKDSWGLYLVLPPLDESAAQLNPRGCGIEVSQRKYSATALNRERLEKVGPQSRHYTVATYGSWPNDVDTKRWTCGTVGLHETGSVFALRQGEWRRQGTGSFVRWGEEVRFVYRNSGALDRQFDNRLNIGIVEVWKIDSYYLPANADTSVATWFRKQGVEVRHRVPSLECVTPCSTFTRSEGPGIHADQDVVFRASGLDTDNEVSVRVIAGTEEASWEVNGKTEDLFFTIGGLCPGAYDLILQNNGQVVFPFRVVDPSPLSRCPGPLSVQIGDSMYPGIGGEPSNVVHIDRDGEIPTIAITAPDKVRWMWRPAPSGGFERGCVEEADLDIRMRLKERLDLGELPSELLVDAGVYGSVSITFELAQANNTPLFTSEPLNDARVRWLASLGWKEPARRATQQGTELRQLTADCDELRNMPWSHPDGKFAPHLRAWRKTRAQQVHPPRIEVS